MLSFLKSKVLSWVDALDAINDPFLEFTRPACLKSVSQTLHEKAALFEEELPSFLSADGKSVYYEIPFDPKVPKPLGDFVLHQGLAIAYNAVRFAATGSFLGYHPEWLEGLARCLIPYGEGGVRLVRGITEDGTIVYDDASNDTATGVLVGCGFTMQFGPPEAQKRASDILKSLAQSLLAHDYALIDAQGNPTTYGALIQGWKTDPLRASLCMAILALTGYEDAYQSLVREYGDLIQFAKMRFWWVNSYSDTHRAAIHLALLGNRRSLGLATDGLKRLWAMEHKTGNAWIACLVAWSTRTLLEPDVAAFKKILSEFDPETQKTNAWHDNTGSQPWVGAHKILWNGEYVVDQPVPVWMKGSDEFRWIRNPYTLTNGTNPASARHHGIGFLLPYWFGRYLGLLTDAD